MHKLEIFSFLHCIKSLQYTVPFCKSLKASFVCSPTIRSTRIPKGNICFHNIAYKGYKGYKVGLQPESLADGNWLVKKNQPVSKIKTKSDTNFRSLYESYSGMH